MASSKKRDRQSVEDEQSEISNESAISLLAEVVSVDILERDVSHLESFELYAHQLRTHLHSDPKVFKMRFSEGYRLLLEELEKKSIT